MTDTPLRQTSPSKPEGAAAYRVRPEVRASVRFLTTSEGGRMGPVIGPWYGCPVRIGADLFDCRLQPTSPGPIALGVTVEVLMQFLRPDFALPLLHVGQEFALWEGRLVASGVVLELLPNQGPPMSPGVL